MEWRWSWVGVEMELGVELELGNSRLRLIVDKVKELIVLRQPLTEL